MEPANFKHEINNEDGNSALNSFLEHAALLKQNDDHSSFHNAGNDETVDILKRLQTENHFQTAPKKKDVQFSEVESYLQNGEV